MVKRSYEHMRQSLSEALRDDLYHNARVMHTPMLARLVDHEVINKCRLSLYGQQSAAIKRFTKKTGDAEDMEALRNRYNDYKIRPSSFELEDNICVIYFNAYGESFEGTDIIDKPEDGYTCGGCHIKMQMSLKLLPDVCPRCGRITPLGRLKKDGILRR